MGPDRALWLYRGKSFLDAGVRLVGSSDRPVTNGAPLRSIQFMVERLSSSGHPVGPDEAITVEDALQAYTINAAYACRWENTLGSITPGKLADLVILDNDPRKVDTSRIGDISVVDTLLGGQMTTLSHA
jgi:predicted amidohydrolase YtcJ